jgi:hypothetical protein
MIKRDFYPGKKEFDAQRELFVSVLLLFVKERFEGAIWLLSPELHSLEQGCKRVNR